MYKVTLFETEHFVFVTNSLQFFDKLHYVFYLCLKFSCMGSKD